MALKGVIDWVADHPYESAGITVAGLATLILIFHHAAPAAQSTDASVATVSPAVQAAEVQAASQLQLAQVAAGAQGNQVNAQVQVAGLTADVQKAIAAIEASVSTSNTSAAANVQNTSITAQENVALANIQAAADAQKAQIAVQTDLISTLKPTTSTSGISDYVSQAYQTYLGRAPDPLAQGWIQGLTTGAITPSQFLADVVNSPEALNDLANGSATASLVTANINGQVSHG